LGDLDAAGVEVDVVPSQAEGLTSAHAGCGGEPEQRRVLALGGPVDECAELRCGPGLGSAIAGGSVPRVWWLHSDGGVRWEQVAVDSVAEGGSDELVKVRDRLRGERSASTATSDEEPLVERSDVLCSQPTQRSVAEVGEQVVWGSPT